MRFFRSCALALLLTAAAAPVAAQSTKMGWVDTNVILRELPMAQDAQKTLEATLQGYSTELQQLLADLQTLEQEYRQQQMTMTPESRQAKEEELLTRRNAIQQRNQELDNQAQQRRAEVFQPVMEAITTAIEEIRVEGEYAMILDVASQAILSADPSLDLTQEVLARLQDGTGTGAAGAGGPPRNDGGR